MKGSAQKGGPSIDLSGYPEDTFLDRSDSLDVDGLGTFASFAHLELNLLTINQGTTTGADDV